jgi:hypothetical protein
MAKKRLIDDNNKIKPAMPKIIEILKTALLPNLSERTLAIKYRRPPKKMVMKMTIFFKG